LATKKHIHANDEFMLDVRRNVQNAMNLVEPDMVVQKCVDITTEQWQGKLNGLAEFMSDHCQAMKYHIEK